MIEVKLLRRLNPATNWREFCLVDADTERPLVWFGLKRPSNRSITEWINSQTSQGENVVIQSSGLLAKEVQVIKGEKGDNGLLATGKSGMCKVTNLWVNPETGKLVVEYDTNPIP